jgi:cell division protein FtsI (penicillin-binding protein 3)
VALTPLRLARRFRQQRLAIDPLADGELPGEAFEVSWRRGVKSRVVVVLCLLGCWVGIIEARLVQLQVFQHDELTEQARRSQEARIAPEAVRGDIVDRRGNLLAYSVEADALVADPSRIEKPDETATAVCRALGDCTPKERTELVARFSSGRLWAPIRSSRAASPEQVQRVTALGLAGIAASAETRRYYPRAELASHVVGFVGGDNTGQAGVEYAFDKLVRGEDGVAFVQFDAKRQRLDSRIEREPVPGATLELTIDLYLQHIAERELRAGVEENSAKSGTAVIMDPATGEILAMASYPSFNPNAVGRSTADQRRNRAISDVYEPGSTFKIVTASAALEEAVVRPSDLIDTNPGYLVLPGRRIRDTHNYGVLPFEDVIVKSSNVGAIKVGMRTGAERLERYVHRFGFGEALAPDLAGQSRGIWNPAGLDEGGLASVSMGYQISVTPLQMATAASVVANGGVLMEPHVVRAVVRGSNREDVAPKALRRVISPRTASTLTTMMEGVVSPRGTAHAANLERYQVAGKTGTAHKVVNGRYSDTEYNASFVGFVPSRNPAFTILVVVDTPRADYYYGGLVAAPIFKRIAEAVLQQTGVPPSAGPASTVVVSARPPVLPSRTPQVASLLSSKTLAAGLTLMPDVRGLGARDAVRLLSGVGLSVRIDGDGFVSQQRPAPGEPVDPGGWGVIGLERPSPPDGSRGIR